MSGQVSNRREEHKRHTRAALEEAAMMLFARNGYETTTVEGIAAQAGVSVRTFFRYFASKQHVLFGDAGYRRVRRLGKALAERPAGEEPVESVRHVMAESDITDPVELAQVRARVTLMAAQPELVSTYLMINAELRRTVADFVAERLDLPPHHPLPLTVSACAAAAWDIALTAWAAGQAKDLAAARREAFDRLAAGVVNLAAITTFTKS